MDSCQSTKSGIGQGDIEFYEEKKIVNLSKEVIDYMLDWG